MSFSLQGLASGMDTSEIIKALMDVERVPYKTLETKKSTLEQQQAVFRQLNTKLVTFNLAVSEMRYESTFNKNNASTSKSGVLTASATDAASKGTYEIEVTKLAKNQVTGLTGIKFGGAADTSIEQYGEATFIMEGKSGKLEDRIVINLAEITGDDKSNKKAMEALVKEINSKSSEYGAKASLINADGKGGYTLSITSTTADRDVSFSFTNVKNAPEIIRDGQDPIPAETKLSGEFQAAQLAQLKVNGVEVTRGSNEIKDLIAGVTLNLTSEDKTTLNVKRDTDAAVTSAENFVNAFNDVIEMINKNLAKPEEKDLTNPLQGDSLLRTIKDSLYSSFNAVISNDGTGRAGVLEQIGLSIDKNVTSSSQRTGKITFDKAAFTAALNENPERVAKMFIDRADEIYETVRTGFSGTNGMLGSRISGYDNQIKMVDDRLETMERSLQAKEERLKSQFNNMEVMMSSLNSTSNWLSSQLSSLYTSQ